MFSVQVEAGLMKVVRCLNKSWTHDSYFSLSKHQCNWSKGGNVQIPWRSRRKYGRFGYFFTDV